ncbi:hypothetical protein VP01_764g5 [Puccinia sorghi]|uniref:Uncharacterized protein n=1 Tax=Puccinia sorghi TaxID=27349 RepID=A0A0L6UBP9_9BASI|nr:hypothetical protein VP01_764g5 [Puccinia sorghi]
MSRTTEIDDDRHDSVGGEWWEWEWGGGVRGEGKSAVATSGILRSRGRGGGSITDSSVAARTTQNHLVSIPPNKFQLDLSSSFLPSWLLKKLTLCFILSFSLFSQCQGPHSCQYRGLWPSLLKIANDEGWRGFFKGNGVNVIRIEFAAPYSAIQFTSYEMAKKVLSGLTETGELTTQLRLIAGGLAGISSVVTTYPLDLVRSRMSIMTARIGDEMGQSHAAGRVQPGMVRTALQVFRNEGGVKGLYRGLVPTVIGVAPYTKYQGEEYPVLRKLVCGALAGAFSQTITYPLDVLRRRMQVAGMAGMGFQYNGPLHALTSIIKSEGLLGLYKGLWPNFLKVLSSSSSSSSPLPLFLSPWFPRCSSSSSSFFIPSPASGRP